MYDLTGGHCLAWGVQGFYIPLEEFTHWAQVHPEYRLEQLLALAACIAESGRLKRKDKQALLASVEQDLKALSLGTLE